MSRSIRAAVSALLPLYFVVAPLTAQSPRLVGTSADDGYLDEMLLNRIEAVAGEGGGGPAAVAIGHELVHASEALPRFYEARAYRPAWTEGSLDAARSLVAAIRSADREGLRPSDYHLARIEGLLASIDSAHTAGVAPASSDLVDLDLLLTDAFLVYGAHLLLGRVDPVELDPEWKAARRSADLPAILERALATGDVKGELAALVPRQPGYERLRDALARYRALQRAGGWPAVEGGGPLRRGDRGDRVRQLRGRLAATRDLDPRLARGDRYDDEVEEAVRRFQLRHGLDATGAVDVMTLAELSAPVEQRIEQIIVNMERWRWLPEDLGARHIRVNIAGFDAAVYEGTTPVLDMKAMVGHQYRKTPVFSDTVRLVVFAPYWNVPRMIAVQDILPKVQADIGYLERNRIEVWQGGRKVDPARVDWAAVDTTRFAYRFRQEPGPTNPLGQVKFLFPNRFDVYVHDTPSREKFDLAERAFSSGCIRVEKPAELAAYLLDSPTWSMERVQTAMEGLQEQTVRVPRPIPIHILYYTAWVDPDGTVEFRNDIYRRDGPVEEALDAAPPMAALRRALPPASG